MKIRLILPFIFLKSSTCQRRITNGSTVSADINTSFVVYMIAASKYLPKPEWPGWLCHGSIIHANLVLTSAACLSDDVTHIFIISGYRKYVPSNLVDEDQCTKHTKRRIISYCVPKFGVLELSYNLSKDDTSWTKGDIAIARVEPAFDFFDSNYLKYCSYIPSTVGINFNRRYEHQSVDTVVFGWGHSQFYRLVNDSADYNEKDLQWASAKIIPRSVCENMIRGKDKEAIKEAIRVSGLCTYWRGHMNANGSFKMQEPPSAHGCEARRSGNTDNCTSGITPDELAGLLNNTNNNTNTRRNGICQNDHGAPLVIWIGGKPHVIGVASAFLVKANMECIGPYVYTSVRANSRFINCVLKSQATNTNTETASQKPLITDTCNEDNVFRIITEKISWINDDLELLSDYDILLE